MGQIAQFQKLYEQKDYTKAKKWLIENQSDFAGDIFHFNMGTVEFKLENIAQARYHFEMAKAKGMYTPALLKNLAASKNVLEVKNVEQGQNWSDYWYQTGVSTGYDTLGVIALLGFVIALASLFWKKIKPSTAFVLIAVFLVPLATKFYFFNDLYYAIPLSSQGVYEGPSKIYEKSSQLPIGAKLIIKDTEQNWAEVIAPSKAAGWIERKDFKSVKL